MKSRQDRHCNPIQLKIVRMSQLNDVLTTFYRVMNIEKAVRPVGLRDILLSGKRNAGWMDLVVINHTTTTMTIAVKNKKRLPPHNQDSSLAAKSLVCRAVDGGNSDRSMPTIARVCMRALTTPCFDSCSTTACIWIFLVKKVIQQMTTKRRG